MNTEHEYDFATGSSVLMVTSEFHKDTTSIASQAQVRDLMLQEIKDEMHSLGSWSVDFEEDVEWETEESYGTVEVTARLTLPKD